MRELIFIQILSTLLSQYVPVYYKLVKKNIKVYKKLNFKALLNPLNPPLHTPHPKDRGGGRGLVLVLLLLAVSNLR